jgi:hypothetical protein
MSLWSDLAGVTNPPPTQYPDGLTFNNCAFSAPHNVLSETERLGTATFNNCSFVATNVPWGNIMVVAEMSGTMNFNSCLFQLDSQRSDVPLQISTPENFNLNVNKCSLTAMGTGTTSTTFSAAFGGVATLKNNQFNSVSGKNPTFLTNQSRAQVISSGNTARTGH